MRFPLVEGLISKPATFFSAAALELHLFADTRQLKAYRKLRLSGGIEGFLESVRILFDERYLC